MTARGLAADIAALALTCAAAVAGGLAGARGPRTLTVDVGPNDAAYLTGFAAQYEIDDGVRGLRWSGYDAAVTVPVVIRGPLTVAWRATRVLPETAVVDVSLAGRPVDRFSCRGGALIERRVDVGPVSEAPAALQFHIDSHDRRGLGLRFDRVAFEIGAGARARASGRARWLPALLAGGLFVALRIAGARRGTAGGVGVAIGVAGSLYWLVQPLAALHLGGKLAVPCVLATLVSALLLRRRPGGTGVVTIFALGYLVKGVGLFHPASFYPDVQQHRRYVVELRDAQGSLLERARRANERLHWGERRIGETVYAMPYSPVFYVPFLALPARHDLIEDAMRHAALLAAAAEPVVAYLIGAATLAPPVGVLAAGLAAALPPLHSRLLLAMWPSVVGHLLDTAAVLAALHFMLAPGAAALGRLALMTVAALLTYIASLFNMGAFLLSLALVERRRAAALLGVLVVTAGLTVAALYGPFTVAFATDIVPHLLTPPASLGPAAEAAQGGLLHALGRVPLFYGPAFPMLAIAGLIVIWRRHPTAGRFFGAWLLAFGVLVVLRAFGGGLFKDLKEILFIGPWIAVLSAVVVYELYGQSRAGRLAAAMVVAGLLVFGLWRYRDSLAEYASPVTVGWRATAPTR